MFFIGRFIVVWSIWLLIADKKRWPELLPIAILAAFLGSTSDIIVTHYKLWMYYDDFLPQLILKILDDLGIYIVTTYLFIQFLPKKQDFFTIAKYIFFWSLLTIIVEWVHLLTGHMKHHKFWNLWLSYICDWILFTLFYLYYKLHSIHMLKYQTNSLAKFADIVVFLDNEGTLTQCYSKWLSTNKYSPNNYIGKKFYEIEGLSNIVVLNEAFQKVLNGHIKVCNFNWKSPKGELYTFENSLSPISDNRNEIIGMIGLLNLVQKKVNHN